MMQSRAVKALLSLCSFLKLEELFANSYCEKLLFVI